MIKFDSLEKQTESNIISALDSLETKKLIYCNHGIGDFLICSRIAKFLNCGVIQTVCNDMIYRKNLCRELAEIEKVKRIELQLCRNDRLAREMKEKFKLEIIYQYNTPELYKLKNFKDKNEFMQTALKTPLNVEVEKTIKNFVIICPNGSGSDPNYRRHLYKKELNYAIKTLQENDKTVFLCGIEKDIKQYGHYKNVCWINTNCIIDEYRNVEKIDTIKFIKLISCAEAVISVNTYLHFLSGFLNVETFVIHSYNDNEEPVITDENKYFFLNLDWYKNKTIASLDEILRIVCK